MTNPHRGTIHHMNINVSNIKRSSKFYGPVFTYLGYDRADHNHEGQWAFEDWKMWLVGSPHEISIVQADEGTEYNKNERRAVGRHNHIAFSATDREDIDKFHEEVLVPLQAQGLCIIEDPPCECPEYSDGYYATFFFDPDGLKFEFVYNPQYEVKRELRATKHEVK